MKNIIQSLSRIIAVALILCCFQSFTLSNIYTDTTTPTVSTLASDYDYEMTQGVNYLRERDVKNAKKYFARARRATKDRTEKDAAKRMISKVKNYYTTCFTTLSLGETKVQANDFKAALQAFTKAKTKANANQKLTVSHAAAYDVELVEEIENLLSNTEMQRADFVEQQIAQGENAFSSRDFQTALDVFQRAEQQASNAEKSTFNLKEKVNGAGYELHFNTAENQISSGSYTAAYQSFKQAMGFKSTAEVRQKIQEAGMAAHQQLLQEAQMQSNSGNFDDALATVNKAKIYHSSTEAAQVKQAIEVTAMHHYLELGEVDANAGEHAKANEQFKKAAEYTREPAVQAKRDEWYQQLVAEGDAAYISSDYATAVRSYTSAGVYKNDNVIKSKITYATNVQKAVELAPNFYSLSGLQKTASYWEAAKQAKYTAQMPNGGPNVVQKAEQYKSAVSLLTNAQREEQAGRSAQARSYMDKINITENTWLNNRKSSSQKPRCGETKSSTVSAKKPFYQHTPRHIKDDKNFNNKLFGRASIKFRMINNTIQMQTYMKAYEISDCGPFPVNCSSTAESRSNWETIYTANDPYFNLQLFTKSVEVAQTQFSDRPNTSKRVNLTTASTPVKEIYFRVNAKGTPYMEVVMKSFQVAFKAKSTNCR